MMITYQGKPPKPNRHSPLILGKWDLWKDAATREDMLVAAAHFDSRLSQQDVLNMLRGRKPNTYEDMTKTDLVAVVQYLWEHPGRSTRLLAGFVGSPTIRRLHVDAWIDIAAYREASQILLRLELECGIPGAARKAEERSIMFDEAEMERIHPDRDDDDDDDDDDYGSIVTVAVAQGRPIRTNERLMLDSV